MLGWSSTICTCRTYCHSFFWHLASRQQTGRRSLIKICNDDFNRMSQSNLKNYGVTFKHPKLKLQCSPLSHSVIAREVNYKTINYWRVLCKKGILYITFLADFHFLQDQAGFPQTDLFWHENHHSIMKLLFLLLRFREITYAKNSYLFLHQRASTKMFISHKIEQNVDFSHVTLKMLISDRKKKKQSKCWFHVKGWFPLAHKQKPIYTDAARCW